MTLYDEPVRATNERTAANLWGIEVAKAVESPLDLEVVRDRLLLGVLQSVADAGHGDLVSPVMALIARRLAGDDPLPSDWERVAVPPGKAVGRRQTGPRPR